MNTLSKSEIKKRGTRGVIWMLIMNGMGLPLAFLITILLGQLSPRVLGTYALVQVFIGVITTFVIYGGPPVLTVFIPKYKDNKSRGEFIYSYLLILLIISVVALSLFWFFPNTLEFLLQRPFNMKYFSVFIFFAITVVLSETLSNIASGLMLIKTVAVSRQLIRIILLPTILLLFYYNKNILVGNALICVMGGFFIGYVFSIIICLVNIVKEQRLTIVPNFSLPAGFWPFSITTMFSTIFAFLYANLDRIAVLSINDLETLGIYQAVLSVNVLLEAIPNLIIPSIIPILSNFLGANHMDAFKSSFSILCRWIVVPITLIALTVMAFSHRILGFFGQEYTQYAFLLNLFGFVSIVRSLSVPTLAVLTCLEKNRFRFFQSLIMIAAQGILTLTLMTPYGIVAIAGIKMFCISVSSIIGVFFVIFKLRMGTEFPISFLAALIAGMAMVVLSFLFESHGWTFSFLSVLLCITVFLKFAKFNLDEMQNIIKFFLKRETNLLFKSID